MNDKEYTYDIDKYTIGVDENGEDGIGLTIATMKDNELHILGSCYGDNARFIDLLIKENQELKQKYENAVADYETTMAEKEQLNSLVNSCQEEIRELKKQLEDISEELELVRCDLHNRTSERDDYERELNECLSQQKEFIDYLEDNWKQTQDIWYIKILQKYKEIIGSDSDD